MKPSKRTRTQIGARVTKSESEQKTKSSNKSRGNYLKPNKWTRVYTGARVTKKTSVRVTKTETEQKNKNSYRGKDN
jgi:hypothetical protein